MNEIINDIQIIDETNVSSNIQREDISNEEDNAIAVRFNEPFNPEKKDTINDNDEVSADIGQVK
jgi:hypothetical protein